MVMEDYIQNIIVSVFIVVIKEKNGLISLCSVEYFFKPPSQVCKLNVIQEFMLVMIKLDSVKRSNL